MQIDVHSHILSLGLDPAFTLEYGREGSLCVFRSMGLLPSHRMPTEQDWEASGYSGRGWPLIGPEECLRDHPGFDRIVLLPMSPQFLEGRVLLGTVDPEGILDVPGPPHPDKCNDYIAACVRTAPDRFIGYASVNPVYQGPQAAVKELERAVKDLGLSGLKLYPMYQHWSPSDREMAFPIFAKAQELGIPVTVHQAGSTRIDAKLELGRPALLDDVGREFRDLRLTIAHVGLPWVEEALFLLTKHPNFYTELSYFIATRTRRDLFLFLHRCEPFFVPLEKLFFGTDYPGYLYDPADLREKLLSVNEEADALSLPRIPQEKLDGIMGNNFARLLEGVSEGEAAGSNVDSE